MIDPELLEQYEVGTDFWCGTDEERVALLTGLDELGYTWMSGHRLLNLTGNDYMVSYNNIHGICYCVNFDKRISKSRRRHEETVLVSDLMRNSASAIIEPDALFEILTFEAEVSPE